MSYKVLLLGLLVGCVNYYFRYLPLHLGVDNVHLTKCNATDILLDTTGIASVCALLVVFTVSEAIHDARWFVPTLVELIILGASLYKTHNIIIPTSSNALGYRSAWKMPIGLQIKTIILEK